MQLTGRAASDPSGDLRRALPPVQAKHFAAVCALSAGLSVIVKFHLRHDQGYFILDKRRKSH
jgi:hypothetical protein